MLANQNWLRKAIDFFSARSPFLESKSSQERKEKKASQQVAEGSKVKSRGIRKKGGGRDLRESERRKRRQVREVVGA